MYAIEYRSLHLRPRRRQWLRRRGSTAEGFMVTLLLLAFRWVVVVAAIEVWDATGRLAESRRKAETLEGWRWSCTLTLPTSTGWNSMGIAWT